MVDGFKLIPNFLTFLRLALIPVLVVMLSYNMNMAALVVFIVAAVTDFLDGLIARRFRAISNFGKLMDPIADKILVMAALVMLVSMRGDIDARPWAPGWMVVLVLARETWVTGLRALAAANGIVVPADFWGKIKSFVQLVAVGFLIYHTPLLVGTQVIHTQFVGEVLLLASIFASYWGAWGYTQSIIGRDSIRN